MTADPDDALTWDGDDSAAGATPSATTPRGRSQEPGVARARAVRAGDAPADADADDEPESLSTAMLLTVGVVGGVYLLYAIGWVVGGLRLQPLARFFVADAMFVPWFVLAVASPALWFLAAWVLTRGRASWIRVAALLLGVVLLVPWPFVTVGVIG